MVILVAFTNKTTTYIYLKIFIFSVLKKKNFSLCTNASVTLSKKVYYSKILFFEAMNNIILGMDVYIIRNLFKWRTLLKHF